MKVFYSRFFANQFKRSAIPNGPKVVAGGSLSPRGDWRMPSDASRAPGSTSSRPTSPRLTHGFDLVRRAHGLARRGFARATGCGTFAQASR